MKFEYYQCILSEVAGLTSSELVQCLVLQSASKGCDLVRSHKLNKVNPWMENLEEHPHVTRSNILPSESSLLPLSHFYISSSARCLGFFADSY